MNDKDCQGYDYSLSRFTKIAVLRTIAAFENRTISTNLTGKQGEKALKVYEKMHSWWCLWIMVIFIGATLITIFWEPAVAEPSQNVTVKFIFIYDFFFCLCLCLCGFFVVLFACFVFESLYANMRNFSWLLLFFLQFTGMVIT